MTEAALAPTKPATLWDLEESLLALIDSEDGVTPEQEAEYRADLARTFAATVEKRNRVAQFIRHCTTMAQAAKEEAARLRMRQVTFEAAEKRLKKYLLWIMQQNDTKRVECDIATFYRKANPSSVDFTDEGKTGCDVPSKYKTLTITVPAEAWEQHVRDYCGLRSAFYRGAPEESRMPFLQEITRTDVSVSRTAIKKAIEAGERVLGADLKIGDERVEIR